MFEHLHAAQHHAFLQAKREGDIKHRQNLLTRATGWLPGDRNFPAEAFDHKAGSYLCFEEEKEGSPGKGQSITALKYVLRDRIEGDGSQPEWTKTAFFASSPTGTARRSSRPGGEESCIFSIGNLSPIKIYSNDIHEKIMNISLKWRIFVIRQK
ncbi:MAG: hypothetical protein GX880_04305 [Methanomicrobiales archaeon]|nr:hypothetical protein [Methanomicrobiales archaeon]